METLGGLQRSPGSAMYSATFRAQFDKKHVSGVSSWSLARASASCVPWSDEGPAPARQECCQSGGCHAGLQMSPGMLQFLRVCLLCCTAAAAAVVDGSIHWESSCHPALLQLCALLD